MSETVQNIAQYRKSHTFLQRDAIYSTDYVCPSVCLSVCPSVTRRYSVEAAQHVIKLTLFTIG